jgi:hypothetical protein
MRFSSEYQPANRGRKPGSLNKVNQLLRETAILLHANIHREDAVFDPLPRPSHRARTLFNRTKTHPSQDCSDARRLSKLFS